VWTKTETITEGNGDKWDAIYTIGFYGPRNGPSPQNYYNSEPYIFMRRIAFGNTPDWWKPGEYNYRLFHSMQIDNTGKKISVVDTWLNENDGSDYIQYFNVSVSDNGEKLTISGARNFLAHETGTYTKISSDPNYNWNDNSGGGGTPTKPDSKEKFYGTYRSVYVSNGKPITEIIYINENIFSIEDNDYPSASLRFNIENWIPDKAPPEYISDYPNAFKVIGSIADARPQSSNPPYLYGNKTAPGFTIDDITSETTCWIYLYFDDDGEELIRTSFSKAGNLNENVYTDSGMPRVYRRID